MVAKMQDELQSDPARVFVTGLSAGAAMTSALLATYPDVFSAGAIIGGLPYRSASSTNEAFGAMYHCPSLPEQQWGDFVRKASPLPQRRPIVSIWHGDADRTVTLSAANEQVRQWCAVHQFADQAPVSDTVDGAVHRAWRDRKGVTLVESYTVPGLAMVCRLRRMPRGTTALAILDRSSSKPAFRHLAHRPELGISAERTIGAAAGPSYVPTPPRPR